MQLVQRPFIRVQSLQQPLQLRFSLAQVVLNLQNTRRRLEIQEGHAGSRPSGIV